MKSFARTKSATFRIYQKRVGTSFKYDIATIKNPMKSEKTYKKWTILAIEIRIAIFDALGLLCNYYMAVKDQPYFHFSIKKCIVDRNIAKIGAGEKERLQ